MPLRYHEQYGREGQFDPNTPNANAGGHPGATFYASTCNCQFYQNTYPYGIGPRLGVAYQIDPKTVLRAGWGINIPEVFVGPPPVPLSAPTEPILCPPTALPMFLLLRNSSNIQVPGAIVTRSLARHRSEPLPGSGHYSERRSRVYGRREPKPAAAHKSMEHRHPARDYPEFRSWKRPTWPIASVW